MRPVRPRHLQGGQRCDEPPQRAGIESRQADLDTHRRALAQALTPGPGGQRAHHGVAQPAADTLPRCQAAAQRRQALRRPVQRMRVELDPRYGQQFGGQPATGGDHIRNHQIRRELPQHRHVQHRHAGGPLVDLRAGVGVVIEFGGIESDQFDGVDADRAGGIQPFGAGEQRRSITGGQELQAQRDGRKRMPGIGSGDDGDAHRPTLPQRPATRLIPMTDQTSELNSA